MNHKTIQFIMILIISICTLAARDQKNSFQKSISDFSGNKVTRTLCNIGNWSYWLHFNSPSAQDPNSRAGGIYPRGTGWLVYSDILFCAGYVRDDNPENPRCVGGLYDYIYNFQPGWVENGEAVSPDNEHVRIYRIRHDWASLYDPEDPDDNLEELRQDAADFFLKNPADVTDDELYTLWEIYRNDWENWPVDLGAPFYDVNGDGEYTPGNEKDLNEDGVISIGEREEPGFAKGDQIVWYVINDLDTVKAFRLGSLPMGFEIQITVWAYNQPSATLGQIIFKRYKMINVSGYHMDNLFVSKMSDPDIGNFADDLAGCDTIRSLGYGYTGFPTDLVFESHNLPPPAVGYDFFQGPLVDGKAGEDRNKNGISDDRDYGIFNLRKVGPGKINLPMTSFYYFASGSGIDNPWWVYEGHAVTRAIYNMLRGYLPYDDLQNPELYKIGSGPDQGKSTVFPLSGDPLLRSGDIDGTGVNIGPSDRRIGLSSGPFSMAPGDTQEVVVAIVGGIIPGEGGDNINSVAQMKLNDDFAQFMYDNLFQAAPTTPAAPKVSVTEMQDQIVLDWGSNLEAVKETEKPGALDFKFEGYNIYQLPNATAQKDQAVLIKTFDVKNDVTTIWGNKFDPRYNKVLNVPLQEGLNSGIQRYFILERDYINDTPLFAGNEYYFAVTAYNYNSDPTLPEPTLESSLLPALIVVPQSINPGYQVDTESGDYLDVQHLSGTGDAKILPLVVSQEKIIDAYYTIVFHSDTNWIDTTFTQSWSMFRGNDTLVNKSTNFNLEDYDFPVTDGFIVKVGDLSFDAPVSFTDISPSSNSAGTYNITDYSVHGWSPTARAIDTWGLGTTDVLRLQRDFELRFTGEYLDPDTVIDGADTLVLHRIKEGTGSVATMGGARSYDISQHPMQNDISPDRTTEGYFQIRVPFEVWDTDMNEQISMVIFDRKQSLPKNSMVDFFAFNPYDRMYTWVMQKPYDGGLTDPDGADGKFLTWNNVFWQTKWEKGDVVKFQYTNPVVAGVDEFSITTFAKSFSKSKQAVDVEKINVFPNPYYAYNPLEPDRFTRFVTITHLPQKATIRIFNLSGVQVRKVEKNDDTQFFKWDLKNESGFPVASGMYIAYIDMPELSKQKVLKIMIIQAQEIIDAF